jgi:hypothetical protein
MESSDYFFWSGIGNRITREEYKKVCELHAKYFDHKVKYLCTCKPSAIQKYIDDLNKVFDNSPKPKIR